MSLTSYRAAPPRGGVGYGQAIRRWLACAGPRLSPGHRSASGSRGSPGLSMAAPPRGDELAGPPGQARGVAFDRRLAAGSSPGEPGVGRVWKAWRRPTLPRLEAQYHRRRGFSRPSSGWDRVLGPSLWPPGRPKPPSAPASLRAVGRARPRTRIRGPAQPVWSAGSELCGCLLGEACRPGFRRSLASPVAAAEPGFRRRWAPAFAGALARPTAPRTCPGSPGLAVLAAGRGVGSRSSD